MGRPPINMTGQVYGSLTAIEVAGRTKLGALRWRCRCLCGKIKIVDGYDLRRGTTVSCGCVRRSRLEQQETHGESKGNWTPEYRAWCAMRSRCNSRNRSDFFRYGGRGITVCKRWAKFENFLDDMGRKPSPKHSLDRKNNNKGYSKRNCRWATYKQQANNRRKPNGGEF